jgi:phosphatidate cytidylyltransferase
MTPEEFDGLDDIEFVPEHPGEKAKAEREAAEEEAKAVDVEPEPEPPPARDPDPDFHVEPGEPRARRPKKKRKPRRSLASILRSETTRRVLWALPWVAFAIVIIAVGGALFAAAMVGLGYIGLREYFAMTERSRPLTTPALLVVTGMIVAAYLGSSFQVLLALACIFPAMFLFAARRDDQRDITYSMAITAMGVAWIGLGFSHAVLLDGLPRHGGALVVDVLVATVLSDTAAYGAGRLFGSRKLAPRISPNKTVEGLAGGVVGGIMGFWLAGLYQDWLTGTQALEMGLAVALLAPIGDLFASMIKRDCEIKDTGKLFGPHGGLIDRLDAILFTIVAGYYLAVALIY